MSSWTPDKLKQEKECQIELLYSQIPKSEGYISYDLNVQINTPAQRRRSDFRMQEHGALISACDSSFNNDKCRIRFILNDTNRDQRIGLRRPIFFPWPYLSTFFIKRLQKKQ